MSKPPELPITISELTLGDEVLRIELAEWNGRLLFSAWRFYRDRVGELKPTKRGLSCGIDRLPEIATASAATVVRARAEGLLPDEEGSR